MKRFRKKYETPKKLWDKARIIEEHAIARKYGLKNMRELWRAKAIVRKFRRRARKLVANPEGKEELFDLLKKMGVLKGDISLDDVLNLKVEDILERRLQTIVYRKGLAKTIKQARQLITHRHIAIGDRIVTVPGYLVDVDEEPLVRYAPRSPLKDPNHPLWAEKPSKEEKKAEKAEEVKENGGEEA